MNFHASFVNLNHRTDRLVHVQAELKRVGIEGHRVRGILPEEFDLEDPRYQVMVRRTPGALGCHYAQVKCMENALAVGENAMVLEDDVVFCKDWDKRLPIIEAFTNTHPWDVFWLGGCYHHDHVWHGKGHPNPDMNGKCFCELGRDWENTDVPDDYIQPIRPATQIIRTYGCWSTHAYIVNVNSIKKILKLLEDNVHLSMGIDWLFIMLEPQLKTFAFNPGCVKQYDNQSDIGNSVTYFSRFSFLGPHWYNDYMR